MGRLPNDGRGRLGGRAKGTPNREFDFTAFTKHILKKRIFVRAENGYRVQQDYFPLDGRAAATSMVAFLVANAINEQTQAIREQTQAILSALGNSSDTSAGSIEQEPEQGPEPEPEPEPDATSEQ